MGGYPLLKEANIKKLQKMKSCMPKLMTPINSLTPMGLPAKCPAWADRDVKEDYELLHLCGKGKKSIVRYAEHMDGGARVVVKSCRKIQMDQKEWETLMEAATIHKELAHPKIVRMKVCYATLRYAMLCHTMM